MPPQSALNRIHPALVGIVITLLVAVVAYLAPIDWAAAAVAAVLFLACYALVLRGDSETIRRHGLGLGGLLEPEPINKGRLAKSAVTALLWTIGLCAIAFPPYAWAYSLWFPQAKTFSLNFGKHFLDEALGQWVLIGLPEEMFYRGYLQSALDERMPPKWTLWGAPMGWGVVISSAIFAAGHFLTLPDPNRLAVFFPALAFGWLRAKTRGIGAPTSFHAACNVFAALLGRSYGIGP